MVLLEFYMSLIHGLERIHELSDSGAKSEKTNHNRDYSDTTSSSFYVT